MSGYDRWLHAEETGMNNEDGGCGQGCGCGSSESLGDSRSAHSPDNGVEISVGAVKRMLDAGEDFLFMDCRKVEEHETAHIKGATLIPMTELSLHLERLREWEDRPIVVHCHKGGRSMTVTTLLRSMGFSNVRSMAGGIQRWSEEIDPAVPRY